MPNAERAEAHKPRKGDGKRWEQPIAGRGTSAALIPALSPRRRCCVRPPGTAESHSLRNENPMGKCSPMFAYVRLCPLNGRKNVEGAARGHWDCKMHEMMKGRSRCGTAVTQPNKPNPTKSDQIRSNPAKSNQVKGIRRGTEAVGGTPTAAGGTPALPDAWGPSRSRPVQGRSRSIKPGTSQISQIKAT
jgi:hypothetical protein